MAHQRKIRDLMAKIRVAQANLSELYDELSDMIPENRIAKRRIESEQRRADLKSKILAQHS